MPYTMQIINDCPQELPFDTRALDALAVDIEELPAYEGMSDEQIAKMLALYNSVHTLTGKSETYFKETYASAIAKIDSLYAAHQWAAVTAVLDALGARAEALPTYAEMTAEQIQEMIALHTDLAAVTEENQRAYLQEKFAVALARLDASYAEYVRAEGLNAIGARKHIVARREPVRGKTECFLLPVICDLVNESRQWQEKRTRAVRTLILYPLNALAEDQMIRLRKALNSKSATAGGARDWLDEHRNGHRFYFGRYTGLTPRGEGTDYELHIGNTGLPVKRPVKQTMKNFCIMFLVLKQIRQSSGSGKR